MPSHRHLAYRRNAQAAAKKHKVRKSDKEQLFEKARDDFGFFCEYVADKPPAAHHKEWHRQLVTNNDSSCLLKIAGPNIDLLGPRGSAKSTVLGLFTAWAIGIHTQAKKPLQILYLSYTVDIARSKSATIKRIIESKNIKKFSLQLSCSKMLRVMSTGQSTINLLVLMLQVKNNLLYVQQDLKDR